MALLEPSDENRQPKEVDTYKLTEAEKLAFGLTGQFEINRISRELDQMSIEQLRKFAFQTLVQYKLYQKQIMEMANNPEWGFLSKIDG